MGPNCGMTGPKRIDKRLRIREIDIGKLKQLIKNEVCIELKSRGRIRM